jgi:hypothetical protein
MITVILIYTYQLNKRESASMIYFTNYLHVSVFHDNNKNKSYYNIWKTPEFLKPIMKNNLFILICAMIH